MLALIIEVSSCSSTLRFAVGSQRRRVIEGRSFLRQVPNGKQCTSSDMGVRVWATQVLPAPVRSPPTHAHLRQTCLLGVGDAGVLTQP
jgi:hypothetical protein